MQTTDKLGLSGAEAATRLRQHGPNALAQLPPIPLWRRFVNFLRPKLYRGRTKLHELLVFFAVLGRF